VLLSFADPSDQMSAVNLALNVFLLCFGYNPIYVCAKDVVLLYLYLVNWLGLEMTGLLFYKK
jgi:hypothetical protein